jgi:hypothetical protein
VALTPDGADVVLRPDTAATMRLVAASSTEAAAELLRAVG